MARAYEPPSALVQTHRERALCAAIYAALYTPSTPILSQPSTYACLLFHYAHVCLLLLVFMRASCVRLPSCGAPACLQALVLLALASCL